MAIAVCITLLFIAPALMAQSGATVTLKRGAITSGGRIVDGSVSGSFAARSVLGQPAALLSTSGPNSEVSSGVQCTFCAQAVSATSAVPSPEFMELGQNYPNPFNPSTSIPFRLGVATRALIRVRDIYGRLVATVFDGERGPGSHTVIFNSANLPSGTYTYELEASGYILKRIMTLMK